MDAARLTLFRNARAFERDLNARQREVLARIARGQTNAEIASALNMTFDGAKWNVSEILTKLNFNSREEAADYWRWRQGIASRVGSALRAMIPASLAVKLVAGGGLVAGLVLVVVFVGISLGIESKEASTEIHSFRMVATFAGGANSGGGTTNITFERQDQTHARTEAVRDDPVDGRIVSVSVADGTYAWQTTSDSEIYTRMQLPTQAEIANSPAGIIGVGMAQARTVKDYLEWLESQYVEPDTTVIPFARVVGSDTVLGVPVLTIEYGPVPNVGAPGQNPSTGTSSVGRLWLDTSTMFILRAEAELTDESRTQLMHAEVTSIEYDVEFAPGTFTFVPPPGKREAVPTPPNPPSTTAR